VERPDDFCSLVAPFLDRVAPVGAAACGCAWSLPARVGGGPPPPRAARSGPT